MISNIPRRDCVQKTVPPPRSEFWEMLRLNSGDSLRRDLADPPSSGSPTNNYAPISDHKKLKSRTFMSRLSLLSWVSSLGWSGDNCRTSLCRRIAPQISRDPDITD